MRFLETVTFMGNDVLVPVDRIKFIHILYKERWEIRIISDDGDWIECFDQDEERVICRYEMIKEILNGKGKNNEI